MCKYVGHRHSRLTNVGDMAGHLDWDQIIEGFEHHGERFGFYSEGSREPLCF